MTTDQFERLMRFFNVKPRQTKRAVRPRRSFQAQGVVVIEVYKEYLDAEERREASPTKRARPKKRIRTMRFGHDRKVFSDHPPVRPAWRDLVYRVVHRDGFAWCLYACYKFDTSTQQLMSFLGYDFDVRRLPPSPA